MCVFPFAGPGTRTPTTAVSTLCTGALTTSAIPTPQLIISRKQNKFAELTHEFSYVTCSKDDESDDQTHVGCDEPPEEGVLLLDVREKTERHQRPDVNTPVEPVKEDSHHVRTLVFHLQGQFMTN